MPDERKRRVSLLKLARQDSTVAAHLQRRGADVQPQAVVAQRVVQIVHADISQRDAESLRFYCDRHYTGSMPLSA